MAPARFCSDFSADVRLAISLSSAAENVDNGENHDPHGIHKMPVQGKHFHARGLLRPDAARQAKQKHDGEHDQTHGDVEGVQADERIIGRSEKVGGDGQPVFIDQAVPLLAGAEQKETAENNREKPQTRNAPRLPRSRNLARSEP